jgi:hypothetical protein
MSLIFVLTFYRRFVAQLIKPHIILHYEMCGKKRYTILNIKHIWLVSYKLWSFYRYKTTPPHQSTKNFIGYLSSFARGRHSEWVARSIRHVAFIPMTVIPNREDNGAVLMHLFFHEFTQSTVRQNILPKYTTEILIWQGICSVFTSRFF